MYAAARPLWVLMWVVNRELSIVTPPVTMQGTYSARVVRGERRGTDIAPGDPRNSVQKRQQPKGDTIAYMPCRTVAAAWKSVEKRT